MLSFSSDWRELLRIVSSVFARHQKLEAKIDELLHEISFIRTRMSNYVGEGRALTYLDCSTPIYINSNDFGSPANILNGGLYEQDNLDVLFSFLNPSTVFLDIGANVGIFSLKVAGRIRPNGCVHAFEPHPELAALLRGSAHLNGLGGLNGAGRPLFVHEVALGKVDETGAFAFPQGHLGGGTRVFAEALGEIKAPIRCLDGYFPADFTFHVAKIDVEGQELSVLEGMRACLERSKDAVLIFEKHGNNRGDETGIEHFLAALGFDIYFIGQGAVLVPVPFGSLEFHAGDFLAARGREVNSNLDRKFFEIHASQLIFPQRPPFDGELAPFTASMEGILFHGPYWHLRRGIYQVTAVGEWNGTLNVTLAQRFGYAVGELSFTSSRKCCEIVIERDLINFECIGRAVAGCSIQLEGFLFKRTG